MSKELYATTSIGNIPRTWQVQKFGEYATFRNGINFKKEQKGSGILTVDVFNMYSDDIYFNTDNLYRVDYNIKADDLLREKDIIFVRSSLKQEGVAWASLFDKHDEQITFCGFLIRARLTTSRIDHIFLTYYFRSMSARRYLVSNSSRLAITNISQMILGNCPIPIPPLPEQRAIAHILQTIQEAKFTRQREIELERERKAALMEHLFTHGTKGEPRKLSEIGEIPESWNVVKLGDKAELRNGINFKKEQKGQGILTVDVLNMYNDGLYFDKENLYRVDRKMKDSDFLKPKDILFVRSSLKQEGVAWPALFGQHDEPITFCGFLIRARLTSEEIDPEFLTHYFRTNYARRFLVSKSARLAITNVSQAILNSCPIVIPSYSEQRLIANIINSIDNKIFALEKEVEQLDELFHAMLEELMTGKRSAVPLIDNL